MLMQLYYFIIKYTIFVVFMNVSVTLETLSTLSNLLLVLQHIHFSTRLSCISDLLNKDIFVIKHRKWIKMSTNKPSFGAVVVEIVYGIFILCSFQ